VGGNIALGGDLVLSGAVSGNDAYYIATDTDSDDPASFCRLSGGNIIHRGARRCVMSGIRQVGNYIRPESAAFCQWERFWVSGVINSNPEGTDSGSYRVPAWFETRGANVTDCLLGFVHYDACSASFIDQVADNHPTRLLVTHIDHDGRGFNKFLQNGRNPEHSLEDCASFIQYSLDRGSRFNGVDRMEFKVNGWYIRFNTFLNGDQDKIRHGRLGEGGDGGTGPKRGNVYEGNLWPNGSANCTNRGAYHKYINNWCVRLGATERPSLSAPLGSGDIDCFVGGSEGRTYPPATLPTGTCPRRVGAYGIVGGGNRGFQIAPKTDNCSLSQYKPKDCRFAPGSSSRQDRNTALNPNDANWGTGLDTSTPIAGADYEKIPRRMFVADVGPRAWRREFVAVLG
jgi:hypothetical protein